MKKNYFLISLSLFLIFVNSESFAQDFENAGTYMGFIGKQHETIAKRFLAYNSASSHGKKAAKVESLKGKLLDEIQESRMNISGMPLFKNDKAYRDSAVSFMKLYFNALNEDYSKIVNMQEIAEQSYDNMEAYMLAKEMVDKKMDDASDELQAEQKKFASNHNVTLLNGTDEIGEMMKKVEETGNYYRPIYLIFYKSFKQEAYMMDAIEKKNINGIEQNRNTLQQYAQDGLAQLEKFSSFKGDNFLIVNCKRLLQFYVKETTDKIPQVSDYFLKEEAFEKMKKEYDKKSDPTKEDVAAFNKMVKELNSAVNTYNSNNNSLNETRGQLIDNWNSVVDAYFDNHMPTYN